MLPVLALVLIAGSVALIILVQPLLGVIALAVTGYISYHLTKFFLNTVRSEVRVFDDQIVFKTSMGAETRFPWEIITIAGWYTADDGNRILYAYAADDDQLISLPPTYERMDELAAEMAAHVELVELFGESGEDLSEVLKQRLYPDEEDALDSEETD